MMQPSDRSQLYGFRIDKLLGKGGASSVYRALDVKTGNVVALKLFRANFFQNKMHIRDLGRSVKTFRKFNHVNVMKIYDFISGDEGEVLVMEYIDGPDMKWYMENRPFHLQERLAVCAQICNGMQYLHDSGTLHHDMKPANVMFTRKGVVKISDYSLYRARLLGLFDSGLKDMITPMYIAPELVRKEKATARSDIYSLGITFYYFFTGKQPFEVDSLERLYHCHLRVKPEHPSTVSNHVPAALGDIIMKCIEKDPADRFSDCDVLRIALAEMGRSRI
jgi:serine/threonine protein kinase